MRVSTMVVFFGLTEIFHVVLFRLLQADGVQAATKCFNRGFQLVPTSDSKCFSGADFAFHEVDIQIQILVVHLVQHTRLDDLADFSQVGYETRLGIHIAFHRDPNRIVVTMPVRVAALSEYFQIFLCRPIRSADFMCRAERFFSCNMHHLAKVGILQVSTLWEGDVSLRPLSSVRLGNFVK